jgi:hypothetical protein
MGIERTSEVWDEPAGNSFMPPPRGSVQIDREGSGSGVFGALRAPATNLLIHEGLLDSTSKPFFFWDRSERNQCASTMKKTAFPLTECA